MEDPREAARGSHVLVTATMAPAPFVTAEWLEPGMLIFSVSAASQLLLDEIEAADLLVTDDFADHISPLSPTRARRGGGACHRGRRRYAGGHPRRRPSGSHDSGRENPGLPPVGLGIEDVAWATAVYWQATELDVGARQRLWEEPIWT